MTDVGVEAPKVSTKSARERYAEKQTEFAAKQGFPAVATSPLRVGPVSTYPHAGIRPPPHSSPLASLPSSLRAPITRVTRVSPVSSHVEANGDPVLSPNGPNLTPPSPLTTVATSPPSDASPSEPAPRLVLSPVKSSGRPLNNHVKQSVEVNSPWSGMESCDGWTELLGKQKVETEIEVRGQCVKCGQMITTDQEREREPVRDEFGRHYYRHLQCPPASESPASLPRVDLDISALMPQLRRLGITDQTKAAAAINNAIRDLQAIQSIYTRPRPSVAAMENPSPFASPDRFLPRPAFRDLPEREQLKYQENDGETEDSALHSDGKLDEDNAGCVSYLDIESLTEFEPSVAAYYQTSIRRLTQQREQGTLTFEEYSEQVKEVNEQVRVAQRRAKAEKGRDLDYEARRSTTSRISMSVYESKEVRAKKEAKAALLVREMETTEETYSTSLTKLVHEFVTVLKIQTKEDSSFGASSSQLATLISNVEALEAFHAKFYKYLVSRQKAQISMGEVIMQLEPMASLYTEYVSNWQHQQEVLSSLRRSSSKFRALEKTVLANMSKPGESASTLESFFILPVQRIPRYVMFLRELVKNTSEGTDAAQFSLLTEGLQKVEVVADQVNQARAKSDAEAALERLRQKARFGFPLEFTGKTLLREDLVKLKGGSINHTLGKITELRLFLFTDLLLWTSETYKFRGQCGLPDMDFLLAPEADTDRVWVEVRWPTGVFVFMMKKNSGGADEKKWANDAIVAKAYRTEKYIAMSSADYVGVESP